MTPTTPPATPPLDAERAELLEHLAGAREALLATVDGLDESRLGEKPTASALCLGGLLKHCATVEEFWLRFTAEGPSSLPFAQGLPEGVTWDDLMAGTAKEYPSWMLEFQRIFQWGPDDSLDGLRKRFEEVAARTEEIVAALPDLSHAQPLPEVPWLPKGERTARKTLLHVTTELARHTGHADILRESLDGHTAT